MIINRLRNKHRGTITIHESPKKERYVYYVAKNLPMFRMRSNIGDKMKGHHYSEMGNNSISFSKQVLLQIINGSRACADFMKYINNVKILK